jgi:hypothetical protein
MNEDEHRLDLFYHAINYRGARTQEAEAMWNQLKLCVMRLLVAERAKCVALLSENGLHKTAYEIIQWKLPSFDE